MAVTNDMLVTDFVFKTDKFESGVNKSNEALELLRETVKGIAEIAKILQKNLEFKTIEKTANEASKSVQNLGVQTESLNEQVKICNNNQLQISANLKETSEATLELTNNMSGFSVATKAAAAAGTALVGIGLYKSFKSFGPNIDSVGKSFSSFIKNVASVKFSLITLAEAGNLLVPIFGLLANAAIASDSSFVKLIGTTLLLSSIIVGVLSIALATLFKWIGNVVSSIGDKLIGAMTLWEEKASNLDRLTNQYIFTLRGFIKTLGEEAVGSIELWESLIAQIVETTSLSRFELQKSVKFLIAEGSALKLSVQDNIKLYKRAVDFSKATGIELTDLVQRITTGLGGQTQALFSLGVNLHETTMAQSDYLEMMNKSWSSMTHGEKIQARFNEFMKQTAPFVGAAANELNTIAGVTDKYNASLLELEVTLGKQGKFTIWYTNILKNLVLVFLSLPESVKETTGMFIDFIGVFLKIGGEILKYIVVLASLATAYKLLNWVLLNNIVIQKMLTWSMASTGAIVGVQTVAVTSLSTAWLNMALIARGVLTTALASLGSMFVALGAKILFLTKMILLCPLFWKALAIIGGIILLATAIKELWNDLDGLLFAQEANNEEGEKTASTFQLIAEAAKQLWKSLASLTKTGVLYLVEGWLEVQKSWYETKKAFASTEELNDLNATIAEIQNRIDRASMLAAMNWEDVTLAITTVTKAMGGMDAATDSTHKKLSRIEIARRELKEFTKDIDRAAIRTGVLGNEWDKLTTAIKDSERRMEAAVKLFAENIEKTDDARESYKRALEDSLTAEAELEKARIDKIKDFRTELNDLTIQRLRDSGKVMEADRMELQQKIDSFRQTEEKLRKIFSLNKDEIDIIQKLGDAYESKMNKKIDGTEELLKIEQSIRDINKEIIELGSDSVESLKLKADYDIFALEATRLRLFQEGKLNAQISESLDEQIEKVKELTSKKEIQVLVEETGTFGAVTKKFIDGIFGGIDFLGNSFNQIFGTNIDKFSEETKNTFTLSSLKFLSKVQSGLSLIYYGIAAIFNPENWKKAAEFLSTVLLVLPSQLVDAVNIFAQATERFIDKFPEAVRKGLEKLPEVLAKALSMLEPLIDVLANAFMTFLDKLPSIIQMILSRLPAIVDKILERLPEILEKVLSTIGTIIAQLIAAVPDIFARIMERLPEIIEKAIIGLADGAGRITLAIINFLLAGGLERIISAFLLGVPRIAEALVFGFINGLLRFKDILFRGFEVPSALTDLPKKLEDGLKKLALTALSESSQIFKVLDIEAAGRGMEQATSIQESIDNALATVNAKFKSLFDILKNAWLWVFERLAELWESLRQVWLWVFQMLTNLWNVLKEAGNYIYNRLKPLFDWIYVNIVKPLTEGIKAAWQFVYDNFIKPIIELFASIPGLITKALENLKNLVTTLGAGIWEGLKSNISSFNFASLGEKIFKGLAGMDLENIGKRIFTGFDWEFFNYDWAKWGGMIAKGFKNAISDIGDIFGGGEGGGGDIWSKIGDAAKSLPFGQYGGHLIPAFQTGGPVPAVLHPNEYVIRSEAVNKFGAPFFDKLNQGVLPQTGGTNQTVSMNVELNLTTTQKLDETYVRNTLIPAIKKEFKRASINGESLIFDRGIRKS